MRAFFFILLGLTVAAIAWWALYGRAWLKAQPWEWSKRYFAWIEPLEISIYKKSETILLARTKMALGVTLTVLTQFRLIDLTPLWPIVPDQYEFYIQTAFNLLPLLITLLGWMDERLRNTSTKPIELVALPDNLPPELEAKVAEADALKAEAVKAVVQEGVVAPVTPQLKDQP